MIEWYIKLKRLLPLWALLPSLLQAQTWYKNTEVNGGLFFLTREIKRTSNGYWLQHGSGVFELDQKGSALNFDYLEVPYFVYPQTRPNGDRRLVVLRKIGSSAQWQLREPDGILRVSDTITDSFNGAVEAIDDSTFVAAGRASLWVFRLDIQGKWHLLLEKKLNLTIPPRDLEVLSGGFLLSVPNYIQRLDTQGILVWETSTTSPVYDLALTTLGVAFAQTDTLDQKINLSMMDPNSGQVLWHKKTALTQTYAITDLPDGGFALLGSFTSGKVAVVKIDALGIEQWRLEPIIGSALGLSILADPDGAVLLTAMKGGNAPLFSIIRVDANGHTGKPEILSKSFRMLETNSLRLLLSPVANLVHDTYGFGLEVPKDSNTTTLYGMAPWIGGLAPDKSLHVSAIDYESPSQSPFQPGPIGGWAGDFDRVWRVSRSEIDQLRLDFEMDGKIDSPVPPDILGWPGRNNPYFTHNMHFLRIKTSGERFYAPFIDRNGDGLYDVYAGDYPLLKGEQMVWWIMNDSVIPNTTGHKPLGLEIAFSAYTYDCTAGTVADRAFFLDYLILHRGTMTFDSVYVGLWADPDIGCQYDDYIGTLPELHSMYAYNQDQTDDGCFPYVGFQVNPPIQSVTWMNQSMDRAWYFNNGSSIPSPPSGTTDPDNDLERYRLLSGYWRDGTPFSVGSGGTSAPVTHAFPDNPALLNGWSMCTANLVAADRRLLASQGPRVFAPGDTFLLQTALAFHSEIPLPCPDITLSLAPEIAQLHQWRDAGILDAAPPLPAVATLQTGAALSLDAAVPGATAYFWSNGATGNAITATQPGAYSVTVTRSSGCDLIAKTLVQTPVNAHIPANTPLWYAVPNPVQSTLILSCPVCAGTMDAFLYNAQGQLQQEQKTIGPTLTFEMTALPNGVYWVVLQQQGGLVGSKKVVKVGNKP